MNMLALKTCFSLLFYLLCHVAFMSKQRFPCHYIWKVLMSEIISPYGGYRRTLSFGYVCLIFHATEVFCKRNYSYKNDALGKTVGQMIGAARSARQNIVEGSSRAGTSKETELRLYDVAKGSLEELAGDYEAFLIGQGYAPWAENDSRVIHLKSIAPDRYNGSILSRHDYGKYILAMRQRFSPYLETESPVDAANGILVVIDQACSLLHRQMESLAESFRENGGFSERMSRARLETRDNQTEAQVPQCPKCGKPMRKMIARKGRNAGRAFWSCMDYPNCNGTRNCMA